MKGEIVPTKLKYFKQLETASPQDHDIFFSLKNFAKFYFHLNGPTHNFLSMLYDRNETRYHLKVWMLRPGTLHTWAWNEFLFRWTFRRSPVSNHQRETTLCHAPVINHQRQFIGNKSSANHIQKNHHQWRITCKCWPLTNHHQWKWMSSE